MTIALRQRPLARVVAGIVRANDGALFDPSDLSTLYQDAVGTIPVTAVEQPVGKMLDKSGNGYHATQSITASRPTLSARKNILLATETLAMQSVTTLAATYTLSFTGTGSVTLSGTAAGTLTGTGTDRVSLTFTPTAGTLTLAVSGSVTKAQIELGAVAGQYQRVNTATDYDTDERYFKKYLRFDGVDDHLNLPYMGLYENGSASVVLAKSALMPTSASHIIAERDAASITSAYILMRHERVGIATDTFIRNNIATILLNGVDYTNQVSPAEVVSVIDTGSEISDFKNNVLRGKQNYTRSGTLTLVNTTIGASNTIGLSLFESMNLYGLIITKSALTYSQRVACERFEARKSGVLM